MSKIGDYLKAVRNEMTHVSWPTRSQAIGYTALVIGISIGVSLLLGASDFVFTSIIEKVLLK